MKLYPFQANGVQEILAGFKHHRVQCLAWYTGAGKTNVMAEVCRRLIEDNPQVKIGVSAYITLEIRDQIAERLESFGLKNKIRVLRYKEPKLMDKNIVVFNPQGLHREEATDRKFDYFFVDESHVGMAGGCVMLKRIMAKFCDQHTKILLVSATPWDTLALKQFAGCPVYKRPLDLGFKDGLITDFKFHAEEAQITFSEDDFTRKGDLGKSAAQRHMAILKSACMGKMEHIIKTYNKELGAKCIVICPPGNFAEIAREMAKRFNGLAFVQERVLDEDGKRSHVTDVGSNLEKFKQDRKTRFLFVVAKCQVGFDMNHLASVVDLTMSRNIQVLAQRTGRIARKNGTQEKHYFYVYDKSFMRDQLEWLVATMIDFCLGAYDGWTTKTAKYYKPEVSGSSRLWVHKQPISTTLKEVIASLKNDEIKNTASLSYVKPHAPPTKWTLDLALKKIKEYESRTDMWLKNPALYKWFRLNAKHEMDQVFPLKYKARAYTEKDIIKILKRAGRIGRTELRRKHPSVYDWIIFRKRGDLLDKYCLPPRFDSWTEERALEALSQIKTWSHIRSVGGLRDWIRRNGGEQKFKGIWMNMVPGAKTRSWVRRKANDKSA